MTFGACVLGVARQLAAGAWRHPRSLLALPQPTHHCLVNPSCDGRACMRAMSCCAGGGASEGSHQVGVHRQAGIGCGCVSAARMRKALAHRALRSLWRALTHVGCTGPCAQEPAKVAVAKDGTVEVQLNSNPTTGYTWQVACKPGQNTLSRDPPTHARARTRRTPGRHSNWAQPLVADTPAQGTGHVLKRALMR